MNEINKIEFLKKLKQEDWFHFIDSVFINFSLPKPFQHKKDYPTELLVEVNDYIMSKSEKVLLDFYQSNLITYYFSLQINEANYEKIYTLHRVFAKIKIKQFSHSIFSQLYTNAFLNKMYKNKIDIHTSLLSMVVELPDIKNNNLTSYLNNTIGKTKNLAFYRVSFRYFIKERTTYEYINYFRNFVNQFDINDNNLRDIASLLVESIMDFRYFNGSFEKFYNYIDEGDFWNELVNSRPKLMEKITDLLNNKYLSTGKNWFDNDIYAKQLKIYINSIKFPPPLIFLDGVLKELKEISINHMALERNLIKINNLKKNWKTFTIVVMDEEKEDPYLDKDYSITEVWIKEKLPNNIIKQANLFPKLSNMKERKKLVNHYMRVYNIEEEEAMEIKKPSETLKNLVYYDEIEALPESAKINIKEQKAESYVQ